MITNDKLNQFHNQNRCLKLFTAPIEYRQMGGQIDMKQNDQGIDKQIDRSMYRQTNRYINGKQNISCDNKIL